MITASEARAKSYDKERINAYVNVYLLKVENAIEKANELFEFSCQLDPPIDVSEKIIIEKLKSLGYSAAIRNSDYGSYLEIKF